MNIAIQENFFERINKSLHHEELRLAQQAEAIARLLQQSTQQLRQLREKPILN